MRQVTAVGKTTSAVASTRRADDRASSGSGCRHFAWSSDLRRPPSVDVGRARYSRSPPSTPLVEARGALRFGEAGYCDLQSSSAIPAEEARDRRRPAAVGRAGSLEPSSASWFRRSTWPEPSQCAQASGGRDWLDAPSRLQPRAGG